LIFVPLSLLLLLTVCLAAIPWAVLFARDLGRVARDRDESRLLGSRSVRATPAITAALAVAWFARGSALPGVLFLAVAAWSFVAQTVMRRKQNPT
jgi:hypothetical protein